MGGPLHTRKWLRNIYTDPIGALGDCKVPDEIDQPYVPKVAECTLLATNSSSNTDNPNSGAEGLAVSRLARMALIIRLLSWLIGM